MRNSLNKRLELAKAVMKEMEKEGFSRGGAELLEEMMQAVKD